MKKVYFLIILTALGLFGSAFFGIYTAPGLEEFPTAKSLGLKNKLANLLESSKANPNTNSKEKDKEKANAKAKIDPVGAEERPVGVFRSNPNGAAAQRNSYLHQNEGKVAPKGK